MMACGLAGKIELTPASVSCKQPRRARAKTLEKAVRAAEMFRRGFTLAKIGGEFGCSREWARQILRIARQEKILSDQEYHLLKGRGHYDSAHNRWQYFCSVAENILHFNRDKYNELRKLYWPCDRNAAARAAYAERSCLEILVDKGSITRQDAKAVAYVLFKFRQRKGTPAQLINDVRYFMRRKELSLKEFALERRICNNNKNPASHALKHIVLAIELGIISPDDYALRSLANFYRVFSTVRKPAPGCKYAEHILKFVLEAHEKTGLPYSRIADFAEVPVQAVYDYKRRVNNKQN